MLSISAACISVSRDTGVNLNNLLFAGQTLPESNGGLDGTPTLVHKEADVPLITAVFDGEEKAGNAAPSTPPMPSAVLWRHLAVPQRRRRCWRNWYAV